MEYYGNMVAILNVLVNFLLLLGTNRLCGHHPSIVRVAVGSALGGVYARCCLLRGFGFLAGTFWRIVSLGMVGWVAFGWSRSTVRRVVIFIVLSMALGGIAAGLSRGGIWPSMIAVCGLLIMCMIGFRNGRGGGALIPVELRYGGKRVSLTALHDTGNTLTDPVTGASVLIVGAEIAQELTGLTKQQLCRPVDTMGVLPGLRLIPYRTVGQTGGMLLALRLPEVKIGSWKGSSLVAFAPEGLSMDGTYQALAGGVV